MGHRCFCKSLLERNVKKVREEMVQHVKELANNLITLQKKAIFKY